MQASGWIQFALYVVALALITKPMGLYLLQVLDANGRTWLDPVLRPLERADLSRDGRGSEQGARLEAIHARHAALQPGRLSVHLRDLRLQHMLPLNPQGLAASEPASVVQHRGKFHHQHQLAELRRRIHHVVFLADGRAGISQFRLAPRPASPSPRRSCAALRGIRPRPSATSGWISCASLTTCCSRSASCSRSSSCRRA